MPRQFIETYYSGSLWSVCSALRLLRTLVWRDLRMRHPGRAGHCVMIIVAPATADLMAKIKALG